MSSETRDSGTTSAISPPSGDGLYEKWKGVVARVARKVARTFPEVEEEDLYQDLFLWIFENDPDQHRDKAENWDAFSYKMLEAVAVDVAWGYRRQALMTSGNYLYRPDDIRTILKEYTFNEEYWKKSIVIDQQPLGNGDRYSETLDFEDRVAVFVDVAKAFDSLPESFKDIIEKNYRDGEELNSTERKTLTRAIDRMADYLNYSRRDYGRGTR